MFQDCLAGGPENFEPQRFRAGVRQRLGWRSGLIGGSDTAEELRRLGEKAYSTILAARSSVDWLKLVPIAAAVVLFR